MAVRCCQTQKGSPGNAPNGDFLDFFAGLRKNRLSFTLILPLTLGIPANVVAAMLLGARTLLVNALQRQGGDIFHESPAFLHPDDRRFPHTRFSLYSMV
jgi:hypothetical protein